MKKKFSPPFVPPRLVKASSGWYIVWYEQNPATGQLQRFRATFNLNRIGNKGIRNARAQAILEEISNSLSSVGYAYAGEQEKALGLTPMAEAIERARKIQSNSSSRATVNSYSSKIKIFMGWARGARIDQAPVIRFNRLQAVRFMDHIRQVRVIGGRTYNNYLTIMRALWNVLIERGYAENNPWKQVGKAKEAGKMRRRFSPRESQVVAKYIAGTLPELYGTILLQYYCFVRPNEIRMLQRRDFNLEAGTLHIKPAVSKTRIERLVTLPAVVRDFFLTHYQDTSPGNFLWGPNMKPHPSIFLSRDHFYKLHRKVLEELLRTGQLENIRGLTLYSWKDTGLTDHAREISLVDLMHQAGHHDPKITMVYIQQGRENPAFRDMDKLLFN